MDAARSRVSLLAFWARQSRHRCSAAVTGFLLTAVPSWTGARGFAGRPLAMLTALWALGRICVATSDLWPLLLVAALELSFLPTLMGLLLPPLLRARNRITSLLAVLTALWLTNVVFYWGLSRGDPAVARHALLVGIDIILLLVTVIGGRIVPAFTASAFKQRGRFEPNARVRGMTPFAAFIVRMFTEMYGVPVTIYLLSGWLQSRYPGLDRLSYDAGHLWWTLAGQHGNPHFGALHILSNLLILGGFVLLSVAWRVLYRAQRQHRLATTGIYARMRHPRYAGFIANHVRFLTSVADDSDARDVSSVGLDVRTAGACRRPRGNSRARPRIRALCGGNSSLDPALGQGCRADRPSAELSSRTAAASTRAGVRS